MNQHISEKGTQGKTKETKGKSVQPKAIQKAWRVTNKSQRTKNLQYLEGAGLGSGDCIDTFRFVFNQMHII